MMNYLRSIILVLLFAMSIHGVFIIWPLFSEGEVVVSGLYYAIASVFGLTIIAAGAVLLVLLVCGIVAGFFTWLFKID